MTTKKVKSQKLSLLLNICKKIWSLLPQNKKKAGLQLWFMMIIGMLLEMLGVGLIIPLIAILTQENILVSYPLLGKVLSKINNPSQEFLVFGAMIILIIVYTIKNTFLAVLSWKQSKFIFALQSDISQKLFSIYLNQPYHFHLQRNSAHLIRNMQGEMAMFINAAVTPCLYLLAEGLMVTGLFTLLVLIEPLGTIMVFSVLVLAVSQFQKYTKHHIVRWGQQRLFHEGLRLKQLHQGLGGVKDVILLGRESDFLNQYASHTQQSMKMNQRQLALQQMPRLWLELLVIIGLAILMGSMIVQKKPIGDILPTLALFAAVSFRLMPSANRIVNAIQQLRFGLPTIDLLYKELNLDMPQQDNLTSNYNKKFETQLKLEDITYTYSNAKEKALDNISLEINKGDFIGFVGESGSGKSTLIDLILGVLTPDSGSILMDGIDINKNLRMWQNQIGYVPQSIFLTDDTLRRNIAFGLSEKDIDDGAVENAIKSAQLEKFIQSLPDGVNTIVGERGVRLSGGQRQRIGIARALYHNPEVLVLDEATSALDMNTESDVMDAISLLHGKKTILLVAHRLSTIEKCDRVYRMDAGALIS
jgi:ATP-binding cassette, subfamily B, bacterial PglK